MGKYANESMEELAAELSAGLARLRKGYVDSAEKLIRIVSPDEDYPLEFVMFRLTGYRKRDPKGSPETMAGKPLRQDLLRLLVSGTGGHLLVSLTATPEQPRNQQHKDNRYFISSHQHLPLQRSHSSKC